MIAPSSLSEVSSAAHWLFTDSGSSSLVKNIFEHLPSPEMLLNCSLVSKKFCTVSRSFLGDLFQRKLSELTDKDIETLAQSIFEKLPPETVDLEKVLSYLKKWQTDPPPIENFFPINLSTFKEQFVSMAVVSSCSIEDSIFEEKLAIMVIDEELKTTDLGKAMHEAWIPHPSKNVERLDPPQNVLDLHKRMLSLSVSLSQAGLTTVAQIKEIGLSIRRKFTAGPLWEDLSRDQIQKMWDLLRALERDPPKRYWGDMLLEDQLRQFHDKLWISESWVEAFKELNEKLKKNGLEFESKDLPKLNGDNLLVFFPEKKMLEYSELLNAIEKGEKEFSLQTRVEGPISPEQVKAFQKKHSILGFDKDANLSINWEVLNFFKNKSSPQPQEPSLPTVCFVGSTGSGITHFLNCCQDLLTRFFGRGSLQTHYQNNIETTSLGVEYSEGQIAFLHEKTSHPIRLLGLEGWSSRLSERALSQWVGKEITEERQKELLEKREEQVKDLGSLGYAQSDVVVFISIQPLNDRRFVRGPLGFARNSPESIEKARKPTLIILQNKLSKGTASDLSSEASTKLFKQNIGDQDWKELNRYYDIRVVQVPYGRDEEQKDEYNQQIEEFLNIIADCIKPIVSQAEPRGSNADWFKKFHQIVVIHELEGGVVLPALDCLVLLDLFDKKDYSNMLGVKPVFLERVGINSSSDLEKLGIRPASVPKVEKFLVEIKRLGQQGDNFYEKQRRSFVTDLKGLCEGVLKLIDTPSDGERKISSKDSFLEVTIGTRRMEEIVNERSTFQARLEEFRDRLESALKDKSALDAFFDHLGKEGNLLDQFRKLLELEKNYQLGLLKACLHPTSAPPLMPS